MKRTLRFSLVLSSLLVIFLSSVAVHADDLLRTIQTDLNDLGYDPGPATGELNMKTRLAIGKYEEANRLPVTGEPSFNLAVSISNQADAHRRSSTTPSTATADTNETEAECLQRLASEKEGRQKRGRALRSLANTGASIANRFGSNLSAASDIMNVSQTADEMTALAHDLGLTADEAARCAQ